MARLMILIATVASLVFFGYLLHNSGQAEKQAEMDSDSEDVG